MHSDIYHSKSGVTGWIRPTQGRVIIPAWRKGDRVLHKPTGIYGTLVEKATAGGELWKLLVMPGKAMTVHASDLELRV